MLVAAQTNFFSPITVFDTNAPASESGIDWKSIIKPVVKVMSDDGTVIYQTGEWYPPTGQYWLLGIGAVLLIGGGMLAAKLMSGGK